MFYYFTSQFEENANRKQVATFSFCVFLSLLKPILQEKNFILFYLMAVHQKMQASAGMVKIFDKKL